MRCCFSAAKKIKSNDICPLAIQNTLKMHLKWLLRFCKVLTKEISHGGILIAL